LFQKHAKRGGERAEVQGISKLLLVVSFKWLSSGLIYYLFCVRNGQL